MPCCWSFSRVVLLIVQMAAWGGSTFLFLDGLKAAESFWLEAVPAGGFTSNTVVVQWRLGGTNTVPGSSWAIRYTLNGDEPSASSFRYNTPLQLSDPSVRSNQLSLIPGTATVNQHTDGWKPPRGLVPKANILRAQFFTNDAPAGPWVTHTYFSGRNPMTHYGLPVISLTIPTNQLFHYTQGIYVLGKIFDDYVKSHPGEPLTGHTPANYTQRGDAWERPAYLEWFEPDGCRTLAQPVLIDIQGQSSRSFRQKSLGLKAGKDGLSPDDFRHRFFPGWTNRQGAIMERFDHLRLANSGNDWAYTMMRDGLCHQLVAPTRLDALAYRPVVVYLDGEFWGIHNLREQGDSDFISDHYDMEPADVVIGEASGVIKEGKAGDELHYQSLIQFVEKADMTQGTNYAWVKTLMDVENYAAYQAAEIYFANADWPHNNIRFWRKRTTTYEPESAYGHDGRWRWLLFDVDLGYGHAWSGGVGENSLALAMSSGGRLGIPNHWSTTLFRRLLLNEEFKNLFINTTADLLNTVFRENRATNLILSMQAALSPAMGDHIARWRTSNDSTNGWRSELATLRFFATQRPAQIRQNVISEFRLGGFANLTLDLEPRGAGEFRVHSIRIHEGVEGASPTNTFPWRGTYFRGIPFEVEAKARPGYRFVGWKNQPELGHEAVRKLQLNSATNLVAVFERSIEPHDLKESPYRFDTWSARSAAGTYPASMLFEQTNVKDPDLQSAMTGVWTAAYDYRSRSRIQGLEEDGVGFVNTSDTQRVGGAGYAGSAVLALKTLGVDPIQVSWVGGTVATNEQDYAIRLQLAVEDGMFVDVLDSQGRPVEYRRQTASGQSEVIGPVDLPSVASNRSFVRLRWKYYLRAAGTGPRAFLRLDDIWVTSRSDSPAAQLALSGGSGGNEWRLHLTSSPRTRWTVEASADLARWIVMTNLITDLGGAANTRINPMIPELEETSKQAHFFRARWQP